MATVGLTGLAYYLSSSHFLASTSTDLSSLQPRPSNFNSQGFLPNGSNAPSNVGPAGASGQNRVVQTGPVRVLCVADVRGMR